MNLWLKTIILVLIGTAYLGAMYFLTTWRDVSDVYEAYYIDNRTLEWDGEQALDYKYCEKIHLGGEQESQRDLARLTGAWGYQNLQAWWSKEKDGRWVLGAGGGVLLRLARADDISVFLNVVASDEAVPFDVYINGCKSGEAVEAVKANSWVGFGVDVNCIHEGRLNAIDIKAQDGAARPQKIVRVRELLVSNGCMPA